MVWLASFKLVGLKTKPPTRTSVQFVFFPPKERVAKVVPWQVDQQVAKINAQSTKTP